jgi:hypothetical protein
VHICCVVRYYYVIEAVVLFYKEIFITTSTVSKGTGCQRSIATVAGCFVCSVFPVRWSGFCVAAVIPAAASHRYAYVRKVDGMFSLFLI